MEKVAHVGVDPGKSGFITLFIDGKFIFFPMPTHKVPTGEKTKTGKEKTKTQFYEDGLVELVFQIAKLTKGYKLLVKVEDVTGRNGWAAQRNFEFGGVARVQRFMFKMLRAEIEMVRPQKWQSYMYQGYDMIKMPSSTGKTMVNDTKAMSSMVANKEYPTIDFRKTERAKNDDDNKTDSFLLCVYSIRRYNKS